jgi:hypothetical protein
MTRCTPKALCSGARAITIWMVLQFGLAMMRSSAVSTCPLISGHHQLLIGHHAPGAAVVDHRAVHLGEARGPFQRGAPPAENRAISGRARDGGLHADHGHILAAEHGSMSPRCARWQQEAIPSTGNARSSSTFSMTPPTSPVAPTTATFMMLRELLRRPKLYLSLRALSVRARRWTTSCNAASTASLYACRCWRKSVPAPR